MHFQHFSIPLTILLVSAAAFPVIAQNSMQEYSSPAGDRTTIRNPSGPSILPDGRIITPIGTQVIVAPHPYGLCLSPDGTHLAASCSGTGPFTLELLSNLQSAHPSHIQKKVTDAFMGLAFTKDNSTLYASSGDDGYIMRCDPSTGKIDAVWTLNGPTDGKNWSGSYSGDIALSPDGKLLYVVDQANFRLVIMDTLTGKPIHSVPMGRYPFGITLSPDGTRAWVVNVGLYAYSPIPVGANGKPGLPFPPFGYNTPQAQNGVFLDGKRIPGLGKPNVPDSFSVWEMNLSSPAQATVINKIKTGILVGQMTPEGFPAVGGSGPSAVTTDGKRVYISNSNDDTIQAFSAESGKLLWTSLLTLTPQTAHLRGVMPFGLALAPNGRRLYAAETGINAIGILNADTGKVIGHLPAAWWPSKLQVSPDGKRLYVACSKGYGSGPNAGPNFHPGPDGTYVGNLLNGVICMIDLPSESALPGYTRQVIHNDGFLPHPATDPGPPLPLLKKEIRYVVFITKENRTFDEVFGALPGVNGLPELARFGAPSTHGSFKNVIVMPNHLALARRFSVSDNFYMDGDVSADGHRWLVDVAPNPWMATTYIQNYGSHSTFSLDQVGRRALFGSNASLAPEDYSEAGSIWENLMRSHIPFRNYGEGYEFAGVDEDPGEMPTGAIENVNIPMPEPLFVNTCRSYPQFNTNIPDQYRVKQFLRDWNKRDFNDFAKMPRFLYFHLPDDHGAGPRPKDGYPFHASYQADNDYALGRLVRFFSHTPYWKKMAIFVTEDDSQSGVDHVDAHRSVCLVISPWVKPGYVSHRHTSVSSILKTIDELLGMPCLNLYDGLASDLTDCFGYTPDYAPYKLLPADKRIFDPSLAKDPKDPAVVPQGVIMDDLSYIKRSLKRQQKERDGK